MTAGQIYIIQYVFGYQRLGKLVSHHLFRQQDMLYPYQLQNFAVQLVFNFGIDNSDAYFFQQCCGQDALLNVAADTQDDRIGLAEAEIADQVFFGGIHTNSLRNLVAYLIHQFLVFVYGNHVHAIFR
jgi:hypothetical protein